MKLNPRIKRILTVLSVVILAVVLTGCTVPRDESGAIVLINESTTFSQIMKDESWFSAIFVWPLSMVLNKLTPYIGVGAAIAVITIVVNTILAVATMKSTIGAQRMQMIQPELERIQRKYEGRDDDASRMRQANEMQALYKKYNISPFGTILVTFLQFPIIMAMYMAVQRAEAVAHGTFLGMDLQLTSWTGIKGIWQGSPSTGWAFLALFIFMGVSQFLSMKIPQILQKKKAEKEAAKHHRKPQIADNKQNKIMQYYMTGMILIFGMTFPAAMSLYWGINSLVNIAKSIIVQKIIDKADEKEGTKR
ncbi:MAG: YidC/Oxa1 family membrane protein insertase [Bulleidia sp.]